jgi:hypothetical protein
MKKLVTLSIVSLLAMGAGDVFAQSDSLQTRFSPRGIKFSLASGSMDMTPERGLSEGEGGMLNFGYGFTDRFTVWLTLIGSDHTSNVDNSTTSFGGVEVNLQHKFNTRSRWQPYAKVGGGLYALDEEDSQVVLIGGGINLAVGLDFFFAKHFGVGAEIMLKKLDYFSRHFETETGGVTTDLYPDLNGDSAGFMLTFTIQ